jgi:hypothetical protein
MLQTSDFSWDYLHFCILLIYVIVMLLEFLQQLNFIIILIVINSKRHLPIYLGTREDRAKFKTLSFPQKTYTF